MILMMLMSWQFSSLGMQLDLQKKIDFQAVATHLGFNIQHIKIQYALFENITFASQGFGAGWILLRMNPRGQFKIVSCTADLGEIKDNYYQTEWLSLAQALSYVPDMKEKRINCLLIPMISL